tara:strand:+ start:158 stop:316 length:159 start_codon:yes stop_codon:yes gene_type:complete
MFEAKLAEGHVFKKIVEAIKDLVTDVNIDVSPSGKLYFQKFRNSVLASISFG